MSVRAAARDPDVMIDINTTPLIDVMLVLLIMLIITIPIQMHAVNLNMPVGNPPPPTEPPVVVTIDVDFDGTVLWNGDIDRRPAGARGAPARRRGAAGAARGPPAPEQARRVQERRRGDGLGAAPRRDQDRPRRQRAVRPLARLDRSRRRAGLCAYERRCACVEFGSGSVGADRVSGRPQACRRMGDSLMRHVSKLGRALRLTAAAAAVAARVRSAVCA